jgi:hypothetical protein
MERILGWRVDNVHYCSSNKLVLSMQTHRNCSSEDFKMFELLSYSKKGIKCVTHFCPSILLTCFMTQV